MASIPCDIVLLPSPPLANIAYETSRELKDHGAMFVLEEGSYYAHISLYMVQLKTEDLKTVNALLSNFARTVPTVALTAKEFHQEAGYIDVEYDHTATIGDIQTKVIELINPLRDGLRKNDLERIKTATGAELENLQTYGYRSVGNEFAPHITFTRFIDEETQPHINKNLNEYDGTFPALGVFEMGDNGTCVKKLFEIPLGST